MNVNQQLASEIYAEIIAIRDAIKNKRFGQYTIDALYQRQELLQRKLNDLLTNKGLLTETEADKIYEELRLSKKKSLETDIKKGILPIILISSVIIVGLYFAFKKRKN